MAKKKIIFMSLGIIIFLVVAYFFLNSAGLLTVFKGVNKVEMFDGGKTIIGLRAIGSGGAGADGSGKIYFSITHPDEAGARQTIWCNKINEASSETCKLSDNNPNLPYPSPELPAQRNSRIGKQFTRLFGDSLLIVEGTLVPQETDLKSKTIKAFGLCYAFKCWIYDVENVGGNDIFYPSKMSMYLKEGGYKENEICLEDSDCGDETKGAIFCSGDILKQKVLRPICQANTCSSSFKESSETIEVCEFGCEVDKCLEEDEEPDDDVPDDEIGFFTKIWDWIKKLFLGEER